MIIVIITVLLLIIIGILNMRVEKKTKEKKVAAVFADRESLPIEVFYQRYYNSTDIPYSVVAGVIKILEQHLDTDMSRLSAYDDFSENLSFLMDYDSMADVEIICALEKEFNIKILDKEAEQTKTVNDIVNLVARKTGLLINTRSL